MKETKNGQFQTALTAIGPKKWIDRRNIEMISMKSLKI